MRSRGSYRTSASALGTSAVARGATKRAMLDPLMVLIPAAIIALAISITLLAGIGPNAAGFTVVALVWASVSLAGANYLWHYNLVVSEGHLRLSKYVGLSPLEVPLGSVQRVSVSAQPAGRMLGKIAFGTGGDMRIEIAPRLWRKAPLRALVTELQALGVDVDDGAWAVIDRG